LVQAHQQSTTVWGVRHLAHSRAAELAIVHDKECEANAVPVSR